MMFPSATCLVCRLVCRDSHDESDDASEDGAAAMLANEQRMKTTEKIKKAGDVAYNAPKDAQTHVPYFMEICTKPSEMMNLLEKGPVATASAEAKSFDSTFTCVLIVSFTRILPRFRVRPSVPHA